MSRNGLPSRQEILSQTRKLYVASLGRLYDSMGELDALRLRLRSLLTEQEQRETFDAEITGITELPHRT